MLTLNKAMPGYEFPLNEKSRTYLRFDSLFGLLRSYASVANAGETIIFFKTLFDFLELAERCDIRTDLMKDLEKQRQKLALLQQIPDVDTDKLSSVLQQAAELVQALPRAPRAASCFKEDRFLGAIRQRFTIPGGLCPFDVPILHHWLALPIATRVAQVDTWLQELDILMRGTDLLLDLWRGQGHAQAVIARSGFYQATAENNDLVRVDVEVDTGHYPTLSGHKTRFAIRFLPLGELETGDIPFTLTCC